ncbi:MAG: ABC transporter permease [Nocardioidaceae bacterium]
MTTGHVVDPRVAELPLVSPAASGGLVDVFRRHYLLRLLVRKELQARYQGSLLGLLWSYVQPLVRFAMYFLVIGLVLGLHKSVPNFAIHMFAGIASVHFFTETFTSGTRSIVRNKALVGKMAMPREMFPVSAVIVSAIHTFPQLLILFLGCLGVGWHPDWQGIGAGLLGAAIITVFGTALALLFSALNVFFKDFQNIVSTITLFTHWAVPMIYPFSRLASSSMGHSWLIQVYLADPLASSVLLIQRCFWIPTFAKHPERVGFPVLPNHFYLLGWLTLAGCVVVLVLCQMAFTKMETKMAERL